MANCKDCGKKIGGGKKANRCRECANVAMRGRSHSEETRQKISYANRGKPTSEECKRKISEALRLKNSGEFIESTKPKIEPRIVNCINCGIEFNDMGRRSTRCNKCRHRIYGKKCPDCGIDISDEADYCSIHNQSHRLAGNGYKIHEAKLRNGSYPPIGTEIIKNDGYVLVKVTNSNSHGSGDGNYLAKHRFVMENIIGRQLTKEEIVHHIDGNKSNNLPENLMIITHKDHNKINHFLGLLSKSSPEDQEKIIETIESRFPHLFMKPPQYQDR